MTASSMLNSEVGDLLDVAVRIAGSSEAIAQINEYSEYYEYFERIKQKFLASKLLNIEKAYLSKIEIAILNDIVDG